MSRIPPHSIADAPESTTETLRELEQRYGRLLNIHAGMAHAPVVLAAYSGIKQAIARHGTFDARTQQAIALAVAAVNDCRYCQAAHTGAARAAGMTLEQTVAVRADTVTFDPKLAALLTLARQIAEDRGEVDEGAWKAAAQAGWSGVELAELFAHVMINVFNNFFTHYAQTELDLPPAPGLED